MFGMRDVLLCIQRWSNHKQMMSGKIAQESGVQGLLHATLIIMLPP